MDRKQIHSAFRCNRKIKHPKGGTYRIIEKGLMKVFGVWTESYTYEDIETYEVYTRAAGDFIKFTVHE